MSNDFWKGFAVGALFAVFMFWAGQSYATELRIVTPKRTGTWQMASNNECVNAAQRIRAKLVKPARFFCDGRRV